MKRLTLVALLAVACSGSRSEAQTATPSPSPVPGFDDILARYERGDPLPGRSLSSLSYGPLPLPPELPVTWTDRLMLRGDAIRAYNEGVSRAQERKHAEAIAAFGKAIKLDPSRPEAHYGIALSYARAGHFDEARSRFQEALRLKPEYLEASAGLSRVNRRIEERQSEPFRP